LNDVPNGGRTRWLSTPSGDELFEKTLPQMGRILGKPAPDVPKTRNNAKIDLSVKPQAGMAVIHFPATVKDYMCMTDPLTSHESEDAVDPKYIMQQFIFADTREAVLKKMSQVWSDNIARRPNNKQAALRFKLLQELQKKKNRLFGSPLEGEEGEGEEGGSRCITPASSPVMFSGSI